ncbi:MAG: hypothetical protein HRT88_12265, partial [Lentisphaeraceae bacterium]|nr:hypothetical protein [Lentisphaeraceae bacterium]
MMKVWTEKKNEYTWLLLTIMAFFTFVPLRELTGENIDFVGTLLHSFILLSAVHCCRHNRKLLILVSLYAAPVLVIIWLGSGQAVQKSIFSLCASTLFYLFFIGVIGADLAKRKEIDRSVLAGSLSIYLLIGMTFAYLFLISETLAPGSFQLVTTDNQNENLRAVFSYHRFFTLPTLGYGDISHLSFPARF